MAYCAKCSSSASLGISILRGEKYRLSTPWWWVAVVTPKIFLYLWVIMPNLIVVEQNEHTQRSKIWPLWTCHINGSFPKFNYMFLYYVLMIFNNFYPNKFTNFQLFCVHTQTWLTALTSRSLSTVINHTSEVQTKSSITILTKECNSDLPITVLCRHCHWQWYSLPVFLLSFSRM